MASGCDQIIIITGRHRRSLRRQLRTRAHARRSQEDRPAQNRPQHFRHDARRLHPPERGAGLGHAVLMAPRAPSATNPSPCCSADDVTDASRPLPSSKWRRSYDAERNARCIAAQVVEGRMISSYGVLDAQAGRRPALTAASSRFKQHAWGSRSPEDAPSSLAVIGRYILTPAIFELPGRDSHSRAGGELQLTDGMRLLLEARKNVRLCLRRPPARYRRQAGLSESNGGIRPEARRPGWSRSVSI